MFSALLLCALALAPAPASAEGARSEPSKPRSSSGLGGGRFLIANRSLQAPLFAESVILLLDYGPEGALGLILNRPGGIPLSQLLPERESLRKRTEPVFVGGPVEPGAVTLLLDGEDPLPDTHRIMAGIQASRSPATLEALLEPAAPPRRFRAYIGYAGWGPGQLDAEVEQGSWTVAPADADIVFTEKPEEVWEKLLRQHGGLRVHHDPSTHSTLARRQAAAEAAPR